MGHLSMEYLVEEEAYSHFRKCPHSGDHVTIMLDQQITYTIG